MDWLNALNEFVKRRRPDEHREVRKSYRLKAMLPAMVVVSATQAIQGMVINVSGRGLKVQIPTSLKRDSQVAVTIMSRPAPGKIASSVTMQARVIWCHKHVDEYDVGLEFIRLERSRPEELATFLELELKLPNRVDSHQKRKSRRVACRLPVRLHPIDEPNGEPIEGQVVDVSPSGIGLITRVALNEGEDYWAEVTLPDGALVGYGTIARCAPIPRQDWLSVTMPRFQMGAGERSRWSRFYRKSLAARQDKL